MWEYIPHGGSGGEVVPPFESPGAEVLDGPDELCVSPRGGLVLCEDGRASQLLRSLTPTGQIFDLARNVVPRLEAIEFAGACFSPDGDTLFVNIQTAGITLADRVCRLAPAEPPRDAV